MRTPCTLAARAGMALTALLTLGAALPLAGQTGAEDSGTFRVWVGGHPVGTEEFSIRQSGVGESAEIIATGHVVLDLPTGRLELTPRLRAQGFNAAPVAYQVDVGGDQPRRIVGTIGNGRFSAKIVSGSGEQLREYVASDGATVLDEGIAHHYYFIARRLRNGRIPILIPRENRQLMATVVGQGEEQVEINGEQVSLFHIVITHPGEHGEHHVWVDALSRVIRVEIPAMEYVAVRTELPR